MGRRVLLVAAVGMGLVVPGAAQAQSAAQDSVEGTALACRQPPNGCLSLPPGQFGTFLRLTADARSGPSGESPVGTMTWDERFVGGFSHIDTNVTCLSVTGDTAVVGVTGIRRITIIAGSIDVVIAGLIRIVDGGGPGAGPDTIELDIEQGLPTPPTPPLPSPTDCSAFRVGVPLDTADDDGNLVVHDAQALPTSKTQCMNGGWKSFGVFKNQGGCVSFVARNGNNQPSGP